LTEPDRAKKLQTQVSIFEEKAMDLSIGTEDEEKLVYRAKKILFFEKSGINS
jgi:hypothetical protein